jgi:hypothetical protein
MKTSRILKPTREWVIDKCKKDFMKKIEELDSNLEVFKEFQSEGFYKSWEDFRALLVKALKKLD